MIISMDVKFILQWFNPRDHYWVDQPLGDRPHVFKTQQEAEHTRVLIAARMRRGTIHQYRLRVVKRTLIEETL